MSEAALHLRLILAITAPSAFLEVNGTPSAIRAIEGLRIFWPTLTLTVATDTQNSAALTELFKARRISHELLDCNPSDPYSLANALLADSQKYEAFIIHDGARPLTHPDLFVRLMSALHAGADAVRPAIAFTETLKIVEDDGIIRETLDRTSVKQISTPEIIRLSAIDPQSKKSGWFLPLKKGVRVEQIEGAPEGLRINTEAERDLLESFLHWRQLNV